MFILPYTMQARDVSRRNFEDVREGGRRESEIAAEKATGNARAVSHMCRVFACSVGSGFQAFRVYCKMQCEAYCEIC